MNFLILGDGHDEHEWARAVARSPADRLIAAYPPLDEFPGLASARDLDDALAIAEVEAAVVGGEAEFRAEALRRVAASGLPAICLHPPGPDSEAYYQVVMSRAETGAVLVPDLSARLHPGVALLRQAIEDDGPERFRLLLVEGSVRAAESDLVRHAFARVVDVVRALLGEVQAVTATGDPPGDRPEHGLVVQIRMTGARRAEVRLTDGPPGPLVITLRGESGVTSLELSENGPSRLTRRPDRADPEETVIEPVDPRLAILNVLHQAVGGRISHPDLLDGTRAMEVSEAVARSLRRGRTVDLYYEEISEAGSFKSVMTSVGCMLLLSILVLVPAALAGPALGFGWTIYIAYLIPPGLVVFALAQLLRFAVRDKSKGSDMSKRG